MPKMLSGKGFTQNLLNLMRQVEENRLCCLDFLTQIYTEDTSSVTFLGTGSEEDPLRAFAEVGDITPGAITGLTPTYVTFANTDGSLTDSALKGDTGSLQWSNGLLVSSPGFPGIFFKTNSTAYSGVLRLGTEVAGSTAKVMVEFVKNISQAYWLVGLDNTSFKVRNAVTSVDAVTVNTTTSNVGIGGVATPSAKLHLAAGSATANTAPLKFTSGALLTNGDAGAVEFLTDKFYATITTGAARKELALIDAALTSGRVPFATTNGRLLDAAGLTWNGTVLNATSLTTSQGTLAAAGSWRLGALQTAAVVADTTRYVEVEIGGVVYRLIVAAP